VILPHFRGEVEIGAQKSAAQFGHQLFHALVGNGATVGYAAIAVVALAVASWRAFQAQGKSSPTRWTGWSGSLARTSANQLVVASFSCSKNR
jgi:hypothetical protein